MQLQGVVLQKALQKHLKTERNMDWSIYLVVDGPVPRFGCNFIVLWFEATVSLQINQHKISMSRQLSCNVCPDRSVYTNIHQYPSWMKSSFLTYINTSSSTMVTIRTTNVLILLCKWKWVLGHKRGSILSFVFFRFFAIEDVYCISKTFFHYRLLWHISLCYKKKASKIISMETHAGASSPETALSLIAMETLYKNTLQVLTIMCLSTFFSLKSEKSFTNSSKEYPRLLSQNINFSFFRRRIEELEAEGLWPRVQRTIIGKDWKAAHLANIKSSLFKKYIFRDKKETRSHRSLMNYKKIRFPFSIQTLTVFLSVCLADFPDFDHSNILLPHKD